MALTPTQVAVAKEIIQYGYDHLSDAEKQVAIAWKQANPNQSIVDAYNAETATGAASTYNVQLALINSDPELKSLFDQAVKEGWSAANFTAQFQNTTWYQTHSNAWRIATTAKLTDPATWASSIKALSERIAKLATQAGVSIDASSIASLADHYLMEGAGSVSGVTDAMLMDGITAMGKIGTGGQAVTIGYNLKTLAGQMGVSYSDDWYKSAEMSVLNGTATTQTFEQAIRDAAKSRFPQFADLIDSGQTVQNIASPYISSMASVLEMDPATISLTDPTVSKGLNSIGADGKPSTMSLWDFEQMLRQDPRWNYTKNARDSVDSSMRSVLQDFGMVW